MEAKYHATLQDHEALKKQVEKFTGMEETLRSIESEKNQLKLDMVGLFIIYVPSINPYCIS